MTKRLYFIRFVCAMITLSNPLWAMEKDYLNEETYAQPCVDLSGKVKADLSDSDYFTIAEKIKNHQMIETIDFSLNPDIPELGFEAIAKALLEHQNLKKLNFQGTLNTKQVLIFFILSKDIDHSHFQELDFSHNKISGWGLFEEIGQFLSKSHNLQVLDLSHTNLNLNISLELSKGIAACQTLKVLKLRNVGFNSNDYRNIVKGIMEGGSVTKLDLSQNKTGNGCGPTPHFLLEYKPLKKLNLSSCDIDNENLIWMAELIVRALDQTKMDQDLHFQLDLSGNKFDDQGKEDFKKLVGNLFHIETQADTFKISPLKSESEDSRLS